MNKDVNVKNYTIGVIVGRFQVHSLHGAHRKLINTVFENHKQVVIFLGIPAGDHTRSNPLDFVTRKAMIQSAYPDAIILPLKDQRSDELWSRKVDELIYITCGEAKALLYGGRDSFIPHYKGRYQTLEIDLGTESLSGTEVRESLAGRVIDSDDFRAGIIYGKHAQRPSIYSTVDVVAYNDAGQILMAKKPNEELYRFIGGFVDPTDESLEHAARREFMEESGQCEIDGLEYVSSHNVKDWRYSRTECSILTTFFAGKFIFGHATATDDIAVLEWVNPKELKKENIMEEHRDLFKMLMNYLIVKEVEDKANKSSEKNLNHLIPNKMKLLEKLNITKDAPFICSVGSLAAVGKTTILSLIAAELVNEHNSVLFITEDNINRMRRKMKDLINISAWNNLYLLEHNFLNTDESMNKFKNMVNSHDFDYIILDTYMIDMKRFEELADLINSKNFSTFVSCQLSNYPSTLKVTELVRSARDLKPIQLSDYFIVAEKIKKLSLKQRVKYLFSQKPNIRLNTIKNRHGKEGSLDIHIDFQKINKQYN